MEIRHHDPEAKPNFYGGCWEKENKFFYNPEEFEKEDSSDPSLVNR